MKIELSLYYQDYLVYILILVNNYELSQWEYYFIKIWSNNSDVPYITSKELLRDLNVDNPIFISFFEPYSIIKYFLEGQVDVTSFIEFICIFGFFPYKPILPILLSISGVQSNRIINDSQVLNFFHMLSIGPDLMTCVFTWLKEVKRDQPDRIDMNVFYTFIDDNQMLLGILGILQDKIIKKIVTKEIHDIIIRKIMFYSNNIDINTFEVPKESCCEYLKRVLFTDLPNPYYCDYRMIMNSSTKDQWIIQYRQRYGYSSRPQHDSLQMRSTSRKGESISSRSHVMKSTRKYTCKDDSSKISLITPRPTLMCTKIVPI